MSSESIPIETSRRELCHEQWKLIQHFKSLEPQLSYLITLYVGQILFLYGSPSLGHAAKHSSKRSVKGQGEKKIKVSMFQNLFQFWFRISWCASFVILWGNFMHCCFCSNFKLFNPYESSQSKLELDYWQRFRKQLIRVYQAFFFYFKAFNKMAIML